MIKPLEQHLKETMVQIKKYQKGELKPIKTNRAWLDHQGGVLPRSFISICGASFSGKSTELENLKSDIMSVDVNPNADNFVWLSNAFEMSNFATTLRDLKKELKVDFKHILGKEFDEKQKEVVGKYYKQKTDGRFFVNHHPLSSKDFLDSVKDFLEHHKDKELVVLDLDHIGLIKSSEFNKKLSVDDVVEGLNELKNTYNNFLVVILTQLNRAILGRLKEQSNECQIRRDDVYMSDTMFFTSDYMYGLQNAFYLGIEEYRKISPDRYPHLEHRFTDPDMKGRVSLESEGCIFVEVLKDRTAEIGAPDIFTIEIKDREEKKKSSLPSPEFGKKTQTEEPKFDSVKFSTSPKDAFGDDDDSVPF